MINRLNFILFWTACLLPWSWVVLFTVYVVRARLYLERWPRPYQPDPNDLGFSLHTTTIYILFLIVLATILIWPGLHAYFRNRGPAKKRESLFYWASMGLFFLVLFIDPGNFLEWFLD